MEELPDRQAADAVRGRIDLKYALSLELSDPGFDFTLLSDFRKRLIDAGAEQMLLDTLLTLFKERGWLKPRQKQRTDSTHVLAKIRAINRLMCVGEAMRFALNSLAIVAPDWLLAHSESTWQDRYGHRIEETFFPKSPTERQGVAEVIGQDGWILLSDIFDPTAPVLLRDIPAVQMLRRIWVQNYCYEDDQVHWREQGNIPPATQFINSPYDPDARFSKKRSTMWTGYKVHLTETCEENLPHLITHVATTPAPRTDEAMSRPSSRLSSIRRLFPHNSICQGSGYVTSQVLVSSQKRFGIEVIGPAPLDVKWQANAKQGFDISQFVVNWEQHHVVCPEAEDEPQLDACPRQSRASGRHRSSSRSKTAVPAPAAGSRIHSDKPDQRRTITVRPQERHEALQAARRQQRTPAFAQQYALRQGIEATISQGVRAFGMRRSRYLGLGKTHLQHIGIVAAINLARIITRARWEGPCSHTPLSFPATL